MIFILERLINQALNQTPLNEEGDKIATIKITQSDISIYTKTSYEVRRESGIVNIEPVPTNKAIIYSDKFNIPTGKIDTYLRTRRRVKPIPSSSKTEDGENIYNIRILYKLNKPGEIYLVVRDLYFRDTVEGETVVKNMELYEDPERIDAKLFLVEYQTDSLDDVLKAMAIKYDYNIIKFDKSFENLYGIRKDGKAVHIKDLPKRTDRGSKVLKFGELAYFPKSSIPLDIKYQYSMAGLDNYSEKMVTYTLPMRQTGKAKGKIYNNILTQSGITLVNGIISDDVVGALLPRPTGNLNPKSVACMQLETISNNNPQYPIETYAEFNIGENLDSTVLEHMEDQKEFMLKKKFDIYIVPSLEMVDQNILNRSVDSKIIVLVNSDNYRDLNKELTVIGDCRIREEFIYKTDYFIEVTQSKVEMNKIHSSIKRMLKTGESMLSSVELNDKKYSYRLFRKFIQEETWTVATFTSGQGVRLVKDSLNKYKTLKGEDEGWGILTENNILHLLLSLSDEDIIGKLDKDNPRVSFIRYVNKDSNGKGEEIAIKVNAYTASDSNSDLNVTIRKYNEFKEEKYRVVNDDLSGEKAEKLKLKVDGFVNASEDLDPLIIKVKETTNTSLLIVSHLLKRNKTVLLVDPKLSIHENNFSEEGRKGIRILRTDNRERIEEVSRDTLPDVILYHLVDDNGAEKELKFREIFVN